MAEQVGDSSKDVLENVKRTARELLQQAAAEENKDKEPKSLVDLTRCKLV